MNRKTISRLTGFAIVALLLVCAGVPGLTGRAAAEGPPDLDITFEAGTVCSFELRLELWGNQQVYREFKDKDGNVVRAFAGGKGNKILLTNTGTGATFSQTGGSATKMVFNADGSTTYKGTGYQIIIFFPTDPAGPGAIQYIGKVVFTTDVNFVTTINDVDAKETDICAALEQ